MSVGERIVELRKYEGLSQGQLADALGVSRQAVSKWETGQSLPDSMKMILLAEVLKSDVEYLTTGRKRDAIRPPVVIKTVETVEKTVEVPVVKVIEKPIEIEKIVEVPNTLKNDYINIAMATLIGIGVIIIAYETLKKKKK